MRGIPFFILLGLILFSSASAISKPTQASMDAWTKTLESEDEKSYLLKVTPSQRRFEVFQEGPTKSSPQHLRILIHRKNDRPLELGLIPVLPDPIRQQESIRYSGRVDRWNQSYIGFELQVSFDKKTWKRIGRLIQSALP